MKNWIDKFFFYRATLSFLQLTVYLNTVVARLYLTDFLYFSFYHKTRSTFQFSSSFALLFVTNFTLRWIYSHLGFWFYGSLDSVSSFFYKEKTIQDNSLWKEKIKTSLFSNMFHNEINFLFSQQFSIKYTSFLILKKVYY